MNCCAAGNLKSLRADKFHIRSVMRKNRLQIPLIPIVNPAIYKSVVHSAPLAMNLSRMALDLTSKDTRRADIRFPVPRFFFFHDGITLAGRKEKIALHA